MSPFDWQKTIAFVTGTNKPNGIGRAIVSALLEAGAAKVYATAREASALDDLTRAHPGRVVAVELDVTDPASIARAVEQASDVNLLVNNAGFAGMNTALGDVAVARREFEVNYFGPMQLTQAFAPVLARGGVSTIVNLNSIASFMSFPDLDTYCDSKAATHLWTQALRRDLARQGTRVIGVYPGPIDTEMAKEIPMEKTSPAHVAAQILSALGTGEETVLPDPTSQQMYRQWREDPKALEAQLTEMGQESAEA